MGRWVSVAEAVGVLEPGTSVVLPPGAGGASAVGREIGRQAERLRDLDVCSALLLSDYPFLREGFRYTTWHVMPPVRSAVDTGTSGSVYAAGDASTQPARMHTPS